MKIAAKRFHGCHTVCWEGSHKQCSTNSCTPRLLIIIVIVPVLTARRRWVQIYDLRTFLSLANIPVVLFSCLYPSVTLYLRLYCLAFVVAPFLCFAFPLILHEAQSVGFGQLAIFPQEQSIAVFAERLYSALSFYIQGLPCKQQFFSMYDIKQLI